METFPIGILLFVFSSILAWKIPWTEEPLTLQSSHATVHGVAKNQTRLSDFTPYTYVCVCVCVWESESRLVISDSLWPHGLYSPWDSPGCSLLWGIFPTQGWNPGVVHCKGNSLPAEPPGKPKNIRVVTYPFSRGSSWPRDRIGVSCIADGFFTSWATWEVIYVCVCVCVCVYMYIYIYTHRCIIRF